MKTVPSFGTGLVLAMLLAACSTDAVSPLPLTPSEVPLLSAAVTSEIEGMMDVSNAQLTALGAPVRIVRAEYITDGVHHAGTTILQKDVGNRRLEEDFVPGDPRRAAYSGIAASGDDITYAIDQTTDAIPTGGLTTATAATDAIRRAMATWDGVNCSDLPLREVPAGAADLGYLAYLLSNGAIGSDRPVADLQHAGFRDLNFGPGVIAATFTIVWIGADGQATDIDNNGRSDVAWREIYYDPSWIWRVDADIDIESIALHEAGHGLSQGHHGNIVVKNSGALDVNPRSVMNAIYQSPFQRLVSTDIGGHCGNWASWPNR